jgi:hypothetical protein
MYFYIGKKVHCVFTVGAAYARRDVYFSANAGTDDTEIRVV